MAYLKTQYSCFVLLFFINFSLLFTAPSFAQLSDSDKPIKIGVLAYRSKESTLKRWQPLEQFFHQHIPQREFIVKALVYDELDKAVQQNKVDFILTNPGHYIQLKANYHLSSPLASLIKNSANHQLARFAGVIFTLASRHDINQLSDLKSQRIAATKTASLGGYQMQSYALHQANLSLPNQKQLHITGMPHDNVVDAVLNKQADVGFVRSGVLESLQQQQKLDLKHLKIINQQTTNFPLIHSTQLYPEWPFAALAHVDRDLASHFAAALLLLHEDPVRHKMNIQGFTIPTDYLPVENGLRALRFPPFDTAPEFTLKDIWQRYAPYISILLALASCILLLSLFLIKLTKRLKRQNKKISDHSAKHMALLSSLSEGVYGINNKGICTFINPAALKLLGYTRSELLDTDTPICPIFLQDHEKQSTKNPIQQTLSDGKTRHLEHLFQRKDGSLFPVQLNIVGLASTTENQQSAVITFTDMSLEKEMLEHNKMLSTALEASQTSIVITDIHANVEWVNPAFETLTGYTKVEAIGHNPAQLLYSGKQDQPFYKNLWDTVLSGKPWKGELINRRKDGSLYDEELYISPVMGEKGKIKHFLAVKHDITQRKQLQNKLKHISEHDTLTELPNRLLLNDRLNQALSLAKRNKTTLALIFLDLDKFKPVNDTFGHDIGDLLLQQVAKRIQICLRESDTVARVGGDEFIILLPNIQNQHNILSLAEKIRSALNQSFDCDNNTLNISSSLGIAIYPEHGLTALELSKNADSAMYQSKNKGRNNVQIFNNVAL